MWRGDWLAGVPLVSPREGERNRELMGTHPWPGRHACFAALPGFNTGANGVLKRFDVTRIIEPMSKVEEKHHKLMRKVVNRERVAQGMPPLEAWSACSESGMSSIMEGYVQQWSPAAERVCFTEQSVKKPYRASHRGDVHTQLWSRDSEPVEVSAFEALLQQDFNAGVVLMGDPM